MVLNAVFDKPDNRDLIEDAARALNILFSGIWLDADSETLKSRILNREDGASDAR